MPGFDLEEVGQLKYGRELHFWDFKNKRVEKTFYLGEDGLVPLEVRFHHSPTSAHGFVGAALSSVMWHFFKEGDDWRAEKVIEVELTADERAALEKSAEAVREPMRAVKL